jgi:shikimate kinase
MHERNIVLIGFMGSGKTAAGKRLSEKLNVAFADIDELIEKEQGTTIADIFSGSGEKHFRDLEKEMAARISREAEEKVIATGGGIVLNPENMANLRQRGVIIWLSVSPETVYQRTKMNRDRPLLSGASPKKKIEELMKLRRHLYSKADFKVETSDRSIDEVAEEILNLLKKRGVCKNGRSK